MLAKLELVHAQKDAKCSFPLGPYPRYTWIHDDAPEDGLDKACYEIWKRVQQLSAQLDPNPKEEKEPEPNHDEVDLEVEETSGTLKGNPEETVPDSCGKDDVSLLVQLEYLSIMGEKANVELHQSKSEENCQVTSGLEQAVKKEKDLQGSNVESLDKNNFLNNILKSVSGTTGQETEPLPKKNNFAKEEATELRPTKSNSQDVVQLDPNSGSSVASNKEICQLLAQFSLKHINESEAPDNKVVMEEAQIIKDFLQNNMFSSAGDKKIDSPPPLASGESQDEQSRRQLPVFAKLCEEPASATKLDSCQLVMAPGTFERREEPPAAPMSLPLASDAKIQEISVSGNDLVKLLCAGQKDAFQKEPEGLESSLAGSPEPKEKAQSGMSNKSEHSYSTSRHALKGSAPSNRKGNQAVKEAGKARDMSAGQSGVKHKEDFNLAKSSESGKEMGHKMAAFALNEDEAKMATAKRDCSPLENPDMQEAEPMAGNASLDSAGPECTASSTDEDNSCGPSLQQAGAVKDAEGRSAGSLFSSQTEAEPPSSEGTSIGYQDKSAPGANLQLPGATYDCGAKYSTNVYPTRFPGGSLPVPSRPPLINYPPVPPGPPAAPSTPSYAQHQPFYQPRTMRLPHQQAGCFVRPGNPYNYSQMAQEYVPRQAYIRATYAPLVGYWSFVPEYSYTARNPPKPLAPVGGSNNPPPMAGDGPQCLFQPAYGYVDSSLTATRFSSGRTGPVYNNSNFQMYYPADGSGYNYW
ncbi:uncharacterized protein C1orf94-like [Heptranchias perlo]|uniref:uncharacterized protein C1orf94-like n=1 Tax=Heptranchias perlo TaxID=212740 RepID=UPI00355A5EF7